ncbi:HlyD family type I secretion periplasmic adaptor subunit, partial [Aliarcobacter butzleri]
FGSGINLPKERWNENDYDYVQSLRAAVAWHHSKTLHWVVIAFLVTLLSLLLCSPFAEIDVVARGSGIAVPSGQNHI